MNFLDKDIIFKIIRYAKSIPLSLWARIICKGFLCNRDTLKKSKNELMLQFGGVVLQNTNICNAKCIFCGGTYDQTRPKYTMDENLYELLLSQIEELGGGGILFSSVYGEPLVDKNFVGKVKLANKKSFIKEITLTTNGTLFKKHGEKNILESGVSAITISTSAFKSEVYEKVYGLKYKAMYKSFKSLLENRASSSKLRIGVSFRSPLSSKKTREMKDFKKIEKKIDSVNFLTRYDKFDGLVDESNLEGDMKIKSVPRLKDTGCLFSIYNLAVYSNGDVGVCGCRDINVSKEMYLGNIRNKTLLEMWNSDKRRDIVYSFERRKMSPICKRCSWYKPWDLHVLKKYNREIEKSSG